LLPMPDRLLDEITDLYVQGQKTVEPRSGRMQVLFMPGSMITLLWRLTSGLSGRSVYEKISPLAGRQGETIFGDQLTVVDDPLNDAYPGATSFDDEGVACSPLTLVEKGVLRSFYYDLKFASKLGVPSTGHGYRTGPWGGDPATIKPQPALTHLVIRPGMATLPQLIAMMDRGLIVEGALGAHSGNIPNGDYSIGVSPGLYVEHGRIIGRVKDAMVAGNIYQTLRNVIALGETLTPSFGGARVPPLLCDGVSVTTKS
jgi:PmbA protein